MTKWSTNKKIGVALATIGIAYLGYALYLILTKSKRDCEKAGGTWDSETKTCIMPKSNDVVMKAYSNLNFEINKSKILESSFPSLNDLATYLNSNTNLKLALEGHTDNVGSETSNQTLSENRAKSVKDYLVSKGVAESRITHKGFGESKPIADNLTEEGKKQNRRVEFIIS